MLERQQGESLASMSVTTLKNLAATCGLFFAFEGMFA